MKVLIVGDYHSRLYEEAFYNSFKSLNFATEKFSWWQYFKGYQYGLEDKSDILKKIYYKFQNKFLIGPTLFKINKDLYKKVQDFEPDLVFIYRGTHIWPQTIKKIKDLGVVVFGYNNDDPFGKKYWKYVWRNFVSSIKLYDHLFVYRHKNAQDLSKLGYYNFSQLRSYYIKEDNYIIPNASNERFNADVSFVGHFEDDGRDECLKYLIDNGVRVKIFGGESWFNSRYYNFFINNLGKISNLNKVDYNLSLNCAKICLVFLSKRNNDTYTRRCFEIPAAGSLMLSEYTQDLDSLFKQGVEADYFCSKEELLDKVKYYLDHDDARKKVASAGNERLLKDGHEVADRVKEIIKTYNQIKNEKDFNN